MNDRLKELEKLIATEKAVLTKLETEYKKLLFEQRNKELEKLQELILKYQHTINFFSEISDVSGLELNHIIVDEVHGELNIYINGYNEREEEY